MHQIHLTMTIEGARPSTVAASILQALESLGNIESFRIEPSYKVAQLMGHGVFTGGDHDRGVYVLGQAEQAQSVAPAQQTVAAMAAGAVPAPAARRGRAAKPETTAPLAQPAATVAEPASAPSPTPSAATPAPAASSGEETPAGNAPSTVEPAAPATATSGAQPAAPTADVSVTAIRAILTPLAQNGKRAEVNQLIQKYGKTLDSIKDDPAKLAAAYADAQALAKGV